LSEEKYKILVVDDDVHILSSVVELLQRRGYIVKAWANGADALKYFKNETFHLIISDIKMPGMTGIELLDKIKEIDTAIPFILMTAYGDISAAVDAMKKGAYDFIEKSLDLLDRLEFTVNRALQHRCLINENTILKDTLQKRWQYIGKSSSIELIRQLVQKIAPSKSTVLITGESGTGKELIARSIHFLSNRHNGSFIKVNCAALPEGLIESELFGHKKGAFTGALQNRSGKFELASGGTLLLDEIGEMPVGVQAKLLRVLQEKEVSKVGGDETIEVDVRIIATSNRDLELEVKKNNFREDLFYRLNVFHIHLPPLRERLDDIPILVDHFVEKCNSDNGLNVTGVEESAIKKIIAYSWPGNIRELENAIERSAVLTMNGKINAEMFSFKNRIHSEEDGLKPGMTIAEAEKNLIFKTLEFCNQNRTKTSEMLDISIRTLRNKLNEYGVQKE